MAMQRSLRATRVGEGEEVGPSARLESNQVAQPYKSCRGNQPHGRSAACWAFTPSGEYLLTDPEHGAIMTDGTTFFKRDPGVTTFFVGLIPFYSVCQSGSGSGGRAGGGATEARSPRSFDVGP